MTDRTTLLKEIDEVSFALNDVTLYLDTHPDCADAISYFNQMAPKREQLLKDFAANFEPLTVDCISKNGGLSDISHGWTDRSMGRRCPLMWNYEKRLQFPVNIKTCCPKTASLIISQFGGPDGELAASMRYLSQRYSMPCKKWPVC